MTKVEGKIAQLLIILDWRNMTTYQYFSKLMVWETFEWNNMLWPYWDISYKKDDSKKHLQIKVGLEANN